MFDNRETGLLKHCSGDYKLKQNLQFESSFKYFYAPFDLADLILRIHPADKIMQWHKDTYARIFFAAFFIRAKIYKKIHVN